jgi:hypothetical protein
MTEPPMYYVLEGKRVRPAADLKEWARMFAAACQVAGDELGGCLVSTVFLGIDHQFGNGPPLLFETMLFNPDGDELVRYSTWEQAEAGHAAMLARVRAAAAEADLDLAAISPVRHKPACPSHVAIRETQAGG